MLSRWMKWWIVTMAAVLAITLPSGALKPAHAQASGDFTRMVFSVMDTPNARTVIWYGSLGALKQVMGLTVNSTAEFNSLSTQARRRFLLETGKQLYYSPFSGFDQLDQWGSAYGVNGLAIDRELVVGEEPNWYAKLEGQFDVATINAALSNLGYQVNDTQFALGADNSDTGQPAGANLNRILTSGNQLFAAPSTVMLQQAVTAQPALVSNAPAYAAVSMALDNANDGTQLISAVLLDASYLNQTVFRGNALAMPGVVDNGQLRDTLGLTAFPLPAYEVAGIGYRYDGKIRVWQVALAYNDEGSANQAKDALLGRLSSYVSIFDPSLRLFDGWQQAANVQNINGVFTVVVTMSTSQQTDVAWADMMRSNDIAFLALQ